MSNSKSSAIEPTVKEEFLSKSWNWFSRYMYPRKSLFVLKGRELNVSLISGRIESTVCAARL